MKNLGTILIVIGITMMAITGFNYVTKKNVADLGIIQVDKDVTHPVRWSPIVGGALLVAGIAAVVFDRKKIV